MKYKIFISSVQGEFKQIRLDLKAFLTGDAVLHRFISEVFLFEELPARDQRADRVYLEEVEHCDIYIGIFGNEYGMVLLRKGFSFAWVKNEAVIIFWLERNETCLRHMRHHTLSLCAQYLWDIYETFGTSNEKGHIWANWAMNRLTYVSMVRGGKGVKGAFKDR